MLHGMKEEHSERINLPLTPSMYAAIKERASREQMSAVAFIRKCIESGIGEPSRLSAIEKRLELLEHVNTVEMSSSESN